MREERIAREKEMIHQPPCSSPEHDNRHSNRKVAEIERNGYMCTFLISFEEFHR